MPMVKTNQPTPSNEVDKRDTHQSYFYFWGKADRNHPEIIHRLIYHMIDVGVVSKVLWREAFPSQLKLHLSQWLNLTEQGCEHLLAFWAALHDLGKASPTFQYQNKLMIPELRQRGFEIRDHYDRPVRHEVITAYALGDEFENLINEETGLDKSWSRQLSLALSGHHGAWHSYDEIMRIPSSECGGNEWNNARRALIRELKRIFAPPSLNPLQLSRAERNVVFTIFSGFVSVVDWLGSDENPFSFKDDYIPLENYANEAERLANIALRDKGWLISLSKPVEFDFPSLFKVNKPHPTQAKVIELASSALMPALVIIESPTGSGKTEAALSLYSLWTASMEHPGLYIAMPTTATSDQMHERATKFLSSRHQMNIKPLLVHSRASLREEELQVAESRSLGENAEDAAQQQTWFLPRKRSLLAPFGVGTVDQTFLSVLQTKHFFVRLLGLSHKVIIFDEIHAYDAYMAEIFCRLLRWLREIGASVILLSATLPEAPRRRFVEAYMGSENEMPSCEYPRLTMATSEGVQVYSLPKPERQPALMLEYISRKIDNIVERVRTELREDGCLAVICNTVRKAQEIYGALDAANKIEPFCPLDNLLLFHARTTQQWRNEIQTTVLSTLTKYAREDGKRPTRMVVVATQVIEQSLDLDFDVMITDLAPLDLLVQRAGRLHRHPPQERPHPYRLLIMEPEVIAEIPQFSRKEYPYEPNFLFRTWVVLKGREFITLTLDAPRLIEQVYGEKNLFDPSSKLAKAMSEAQQNWERERSAAKREAGKMLVSKPNSATLLGQSNRELSEDDDPQTGLVLRALTRRDAPGISLVCLHRVNGLICLDAEGHEPVDVDHPDPVQVLKLAQQIVTVSSKPVIEHFQYKTENHYPASWKKIALLRYSRLAIFENNQYLNSTEFTLRLTRTLGLEIDYQKFGGQDDEL